MKLERTRIITRWIVAISTFLFMSGSFVHWIRDESKNDAASVAEKIAPLVKADFDAIEKSMDRIETFLKQLIRGGGAVTRVITGIASYYGRGDSFSGRLTASGRIFDEDSMVMAHLSLPFGTKVLVFNVDTGRGAIGIVDDRGPAIEGRVVDVSWGMAKKLGMETMGIARVVVVPMVNM